MRTARASQRSDNAAWANSSRASLRCPAISPRTIPPGGSEAWGVKSVTGTRGGVAARPGLGLTLRRSAEQTLCDVVAWSGGAIVARTIPSVRLWDLRPMAGEAKSEVE